MRDLGLNTEHSYSLMKAAIVKDKNGKMVNLVKLRNPHGTGEWNGKWSDKSDQWSEELMKELDHEVKDDGIFWMEFMEMAYFFQKI